MLIGLSCVSRAQVAVQHKEGLVHGFLVLRTLEGESLADGELVQNARGDRVTSRLTFHFKDGSLNDEVVIFSQRGTFRLISDHLVQKGPAFAHPIDMILNGSSGEVTVLYTEDGKDKTAKDRLNLSGNAANGILLTLLKNVRPDGPETKLSFVVPTPKPKLVTLLVDKQGEDRFLTGNASHTATRFSGKFEIGGITGVLASLLGKTPPDLKVWILEGEAPALVRLEGPLAPGGPVWRIEQVSPTWPGASKEQK